MMMMTVGAVYEVGGGRGHSPNVKGGGLPLVNWWAGCMMVDGV